jgi:small basic protein (TIGR04137 family)
VGRRRITAGANRIGREVRDLPLQELADLFATRSEKDMSQHRSLKAASTLAAKRNVLKRFERVAILKKHGDWKEGDRVTGLRKTKG